jgi:hypothetical protein
MQDAWLDSFICFGYALSILHGITMINERGNPNFKSPAAAAVLPYE